MEDIKNNLITIIQSILKDLVDQDQDLKIQLSHPENLLHGDLTTNIALILNSKLKTKNEKFSSTRDLAQKIVDELKKNSELTSYFSKITVEGPGFLNFWFDKKYLFENLNEIIVNEKFGGSKNLNNQKVMVEFTDPNPFKEFHIGHLYSNTVGESISRLLESQGADVKRVCYQGDVGLHVAKSIFGMRQKLKTQNLKLENLEFNSFKERVKFLGEAYALGSSKFEEDVESKQEITSLNKKIFEKSDPEINELYEKGKAWSLEYFESMYKRLGMSFWKLYFESEAGVVGSKIVKEHVSNGIFVESDGAVIFPGEKYGLHNRVFINSLGLPTYEAKELGLAPTKYQDFAYDNSIIITGNEVNAYFQVVLKALSLINPDLADKTIHKSHGMVRLPDGKMSSRTGKVITGEWLLDEAKSKISASYTDMSPEILENVAVAAVKYALLRTSIGHDIEFNFDESISLEGNSGPYLQYAYVRTQSIIAKSKLKTQNSKVQIKSQNLEKEEEELLRYLIQFPAVVEEAAIQYAPNSISNYLFNLAQKFNLFYQKYTILGDAQTIDFRLSLTSAVGNVLKNGLYLLGIQTVGKM